VDRSKLSLFSDQACAVSLYLLLLLIPVSSALIESLFGFAFLFFIGRLMTTPGLFAQLIRKEKIVLLFFAALVLSLVNSSPFLPISLHALFLKWGKYIVLYLIIAQTLNTSPRVKKALVSISVGLTAIILDCFYQLLFHVDLLHRQAMMQHANKIMALTGPFNHNNGLSAYLSCMLIVVLYWVFSKESRVVRSVAGLVFFFGLFILAHAYSRGAWFAFVLAITILACFLRRFLFIGISMLLTVLLSIKFILFKCFTFRDSGRFELWGIGFKMINQHPLLGNGIGTFMARFRDFSSSRGISYAHNCFVQLWAEAGFIALAVFIFYIFTVLREGVLAYQLKRDYILLILICAIISHITSSFFDTNLFSSQLAFLFWALMGLLRGAACLSIS